MVDTLKNCPLCGSSDISLEELKHKTQSNYYISCDTCWLRTTSSISKEQAVIGWNTRASDTKIESLTAQLEEAKALLRIVGSNIDNYYYEPINKRIREILTKEC